jgi:ABC-type Mn2+/Zn2+ transport system ATPase subunit
MRLLDRHAARLRSRGRTGEGRHPMIAVPPATDRGSVDLVRFDHVSLGYGRHRVLTDLHFQVQRGDYLGIVGPNGVGKTTLLKALLGVLKPIAGRIITDRGRRLRFGYVPQRQTVEEVIPLTVREIAVSGCYGRLGAIGRPTSRHREIAEQALGAAGILDLAHRLYRELSGGQKQRTLMARALAGEPDILVLDEPTNDLDVAGERAIMALIDRLHAERAMTVVMVSHLLEVVVNHVRQIGFLGNAEFRPLPIEELMGTAYLRDLYGVPVEVVEFRGQRVVI